MGRWQMGSAGMDPRGREEEPMQGSLFSYPRRPQAPTAAPRVRLASGPTRRKAPLTFEFLGIFQYLSSVNHSHGSWPIHGFLLCWPRFQQLSLGFQHPDARWKLALGRHRISEHELDLVRHGAHPPGGALTPGSSGLSNHPPSMNPVGLSSPKPTAPTKRRLESFREVWRALQRCSQRKGRSPAGRRSSAGNGAK